MKKSSFMNILTTSCWIREGEGRSRSISICREKETSECSWILLCVCTPSSPFSSSSLLASFQRTTQHIQTHTVHLTPPRPPPIIIITIHPLIPLLSTDMKIDGGTERSMNFAADTNKRCLPPHSSYSSRPTILYEWIDKLLSLSSLEKSQPNK